MVVKQAPTLSSLQSIQELVSTSLLTTAQLCLSTIHGFTSEVQSADCNQQTAWNDLQQLSALFSLQLQLIDELKPIFQHGHQLVDKLISRMGERREVGSISSELDDNEPSKLEFDLTAICEVLPFLPSKRSRRGNAEAEAKGDEVTQSTGNEASSTNRTGITLPPNDMRPFAIPPYHLPQLSSRVAISFFEKHVIPAMKAIPTPTSPGMTTSALFEILWRICSFTSLQVDLRTGDIAFQNGILEISNNVLVIVKKEEKDENNNGRQCGQEANLSTAQHTSFPVCNFGNPMFRQNTPWKNRGNSPNLSQPANNNDNEKECDVIIANTETNEMTVLHVLSYDSLFIELDISGLEKNVILDLNDEGRRWEGVLLNGKPFGFGCEFSEEGNLVYEGFVFDGHRVCVGKEFHDDGNNNRCVYEGGYCNNKRWGRGTSYDLNGAVDFDGEWMNNRGIGENEKNINDLIVPTGIEEFMIDDKKFNDDNITSLHFSPLLARLKRIEIGNVCYRHVREFVIDGLDSLESVKIGERCFGIDDRRYIYDICRITNCPILRQLEIGNYSFRDFKSFELSNLNSLQSINFGKCCFIYAEGFSLKGE